MFNKIEFKKIRDFGEIINDTFTFIRQNFKPLLKVFLYMCGFFVLASLIGNTLQQISLLKSVREITNGQMRSRFTMFNTQYFVSLFFTFANYNAITVAVLSYIAIYVEKGKVIPTVEEVWGYFKYYFLRTFVSAIIITLFMILCAIPCGIPLIYVFPMTTLIIPIMIFENAGFSYSFNRSFKLIKENWGLTAGALFIIWIITYATVFVGSIPGIVLNIAGTVATGGKGVNVMIIIFSVLSQSLFQVFLIIPTVCAAICYFNLVERHENSGLMGRINDMGEKKADFNGTEEY